MYNPGELLQCLLLSQCVCEQRSFACSWFVCRSSLLRQYSYTELKRSEEHLNKEVKHLRDQLAKHNAHIISLNSAHKEQTAALEVGNGNVLPARTLFTCKLYTLAALSACSTRCSCAVHAHPRSCSLMLEFAQLCLSHVLVVVAPVRDLAPAPIRPLCPTHSPTLSLPTYTHTHTQLSLSTTRSHNCKNSLSSGNNLKQSVHRREAQRPMCISTCTHSWTPNRRCSPLNWKLPERSTPTRSRNCKRNSAVWKLALRTPSSVWRRTASIPVGVMMMCE
jgi:hypothetical protein